MWLLFPVSALADEIVLQNDTSDSFDGTDSVAWLQYPECAVTVLTPDAADLPLEIDTVLVYLGSSQGNQDHLDTALSMGIDLVDDPAAPGLPGVDTWDWTETLFLVPVSSDRFVSLSLDDADNGLAPLTVTGGYVAVWVCAPDPSWGYGEWPREDEDDTSGLVIDGDASPEGSFLYDGEALTLTPLADLGVDGAWVIRAVSGADDPGDTGGDTGDTGEVATAALDLLAVTPAAATEGEAAEVTLTGTGFDPAAEATIGGLVVTAPVVTTDAITGRSPSGLPPGTHDVMVRNPDGSTDTLVAAFVVTEEGAPPSGDGCGCATPGTEGRGLVGSLLIWTLRRRAAGTSGRNLRHGRRSGT